MIITIMMKTMVMTNSVDAAASFVFHLLICHEYISMACIFFSNVSLFLLYPV